MNKSMQVKELVKELKKHDQNAEFLVSSDEELNTLYTKWEVSVLEGEKKPTVVIWGYSGSEQDEVFEEEDTKSVEELIAEELEATKKCRSCGVSLMLDEEVEDGYCVSCGK